MTGGFERRAARRTPASINTPAHQALEAMWRLEAPRVTARIARLVGDLATAEELTRR